MFKTDPGCKIHWELTDMCNLKCPMCPRTNIDDHCRPVKDVQNIQFFLEDVKKYFSDDFLKKLKRIDFCGNLGDPCMAREFYEICEFLIKGYGITIVVSTNGTMKNPSWWRKLGALFAGTPSCVEFHIDGLKDTNYLYRIGASWHRIMANTAAFISGGGEAGWIYIVFKHNQHQVDEAREAARDMKFKYFVRVDTGRFPQDGIFRYMHPDGDIRHLEQARASVHHRAGDASTTVFHHPDEAVGYPAAGKKGDAGSAATENNPFEIRKGSPSAAVNGITCKASKQNRFFIDAGGYVAPCCWVSNTDFQNPGNMLKVIMTAGKDLENFNIRNRPVEQILQDLWAPEHSSVVFER